MYNNKKQNKKENNTNNKYNNKNRSFNKENEDRNEKQNIQDKFVEKMKNSIVATKFGESSYLDAMKTETVTTNIEIKESIDLSQQNPTTLFYRHLTKEGMKDAVQKSSIIYFKRIFVILEKYFKDMKYNDDHDITLDEACSLITDGVPLDGIFLKGELNITSGSNYSSGWVIVNPLDIFTKEYFISNLKSKYTSQTIENIFAGHIARSIKIKVSAENINRAFDKDIVCVFVDEYKKEENKCCNWNFDHLREKLNEINKIKEEERNKNDEEESDKEEAKQDCNDDNTLTMKFVTWSGKVVGIEKHYISDYEKEDNEIEKKVQMKLQMFKELNLKLRNNNDEDQKKIIKKEVDDIKAEVFKLIEDSKSLFLCMYNSINSSRRHNGVPNLQSDNKELLELVQDTINNDTVNYSKEVVLKPINSKYPNMLIADNYDGISEGKMYVIRITKKNMEEWKISDKYVNTKIIDEFCEIDDYDSYDKYSLTKANFTWDKYDDEDDKVISIYETEMQELMNNIWEETCRRSTSLQITLKSLNEKEKKHLKDYYCDVIGLGDGIKKDILLAPLVDKETFGIMKNLFQEKSKRRDFRDTLIFTIDPWSAKDFDDAVHISPMFTPQHEELYKKEYELSKSYVIDKWDYYNRLGGYKSKDVIGFEIGVHIADVTHYVTPDSPIDEKARSCTTSVYLCDKCEAMLPKRLSDCLCSLNPIVPRYGFSLTWKMTKDAKMLPQTVWFGKSIISSFARLDYVCAQEFIDNDNFLTIKEKMTENETRFLGKWPVKYGYSSSIYAAVRALNKLARILRTDRKKLGALTLSSQNPYFVLNVDNQKPEIKEVEEAAEAHSLIEEYMVIANQLVARRIIASFPSLPVLRNHPAPTKVQQYLDELSQLGFTINMQTGQTLVQDLTKIANNIEKSYNKEIKEDYFVKNKKSKPEYIMNEVVNTSFMMTSLSPATYIIGMLKEYQLLSHWGLSIPFYMHFTSPIRRYADDIAHRMLALGLHLEKEFYNKFPSLETKYKYNEVNGNFEPYYLYDKTKQDESMDGEVLLKISTGELEMSEETAIKIKKYRPHTLEFLETVKLYGEIPSNQLPPLELRMSAEKVCPPKIRLNNKEGRTEKVTRECVQKNSGFSNTYKELIETGNSDSFVNLKSYEVKKMINIINEIGASNFVEKSKNPVITKTESKKSEKKLDAIDSNYDNDDDETTNSNNDYFDEEEDEEKKQKKSLALYVISSVSQELLTGLNYTYEKIMEIFEDCNTKNKAADSASKIHSDIFLALYIKDLPKKEIKTYVYPVYFDIEKSTISFYVPAFGKMVDINDAIFGSGTLFSDEKENYKKTEFIVPVFDIESPIDDQNIIGDLSNNKLEEEIVSQINLKINNSIKKNKDFNDLFNSESDIENEEVKQENEENEEKNERKKVSLRLQLFRPVSCFIREASTSSAVLGVSIYIDPNDNCVGESNEALIDIIIESRKKIDEDKTKEYK